MNYEQKYLKYKKKYINLKQKGGESIIENKKPINVLLVSHNSRIRCFIDSLKSLVNNKIIPTSIIDNILKINKKSEKEIRFKNAAILKVSLLKGTKTGHISLFYAGELEEKNSENGLYFENKYNQNNQNKSEILFGEYDFDYTESFGIPQIDFDVDFYLGRHGEGTHNLKETYKILTFITATGIDPTLTAAGEIQAENAGLAISKKDIRFDIVFVSKLKRTRQTAYLFLTEQVHNIKKFFVLPCSHELLYRKDTNCDTYTSFIPRGSENVSNCESMINTPITSEACTNFTMTYFNKNVKTEVIDVPVDWAYYNDFYTKVQVCKKCEAGTCIDSKCANMDRCANTNMFKEAISILSIEKNNLLKSQ